MGTPVPIFYSTSLLYTLLSLLLNFNFIPEFMQKGTHCVPFCIPPLCFMLYSLIFTLFSLLYHLYSKTFTKFIPAGDSSFLLFALFFVLLKKLNSFFKLKAKTRPLFHLRFHLDLATMGLNDVFHDGKS